MFEAMKQDLFPGEQTKVKSSGGTGTVRVKYTPSKEKLNIVRGLLELMRQIFIMAEDFLKEKQSCL